ncbi:MAG: TAXI family TRAP transporter solute-binding subunit [Chloroflexi bacterium]|nr:TAXI family TRAP transporter solute-binding subunit [Chloroflexota bacterium]MBI4504110.1 TAXI family TRAP transporter solute-binding subunit [Chloroflexota bacterium]
MVRLHYTAATAMALAIAWAIGGCSAPPPQQSAPAAAPAPAQKPAQPAAPAPAAAAPAKPAAEKPAAAAQPAKPAASKDFQPNVRFIRIGSGSGGSWPPTAAKLAELINKNVPGVQANAVPGSLSQHMVGLQNKQYEVALTYGDVAYDAFAGVRKPYEKPHDVVRHVASLHPGAFSIIARADSPFKTVEDLAKHPIRTAVLERLGGIQYDGGKIVLRSLGLDIDKLGDKGGVLNVGVNYANQVQAMQDGHVNVLFFHGPVPYPTIVQVEQTTPVRFLHLTDPIIAELKKGLKGYPEVIVPKGTYKYLDNDYRTVGTTAQFAARADLSDELVYRITAAWWDNVADARTVGAWGKDFVLENALAGVTIPVHPGAARYYAEKGVKARD